MSRARRGAWLLLGLLPLLHDRETRADEGASAPFGLVYSVDAPGEGCPEEGWFRERIEALARRSLFGKPEEERGVLWVLLRRVDRSLRLDVMLRTPGGVQGVRGFQSEEQTCTQLLEAAALSLSIAALATLPPAPTMASASALPVAPPPASVPAQGATGGAPVAPAIRAQPRYELELGPAVVSGWAPSFTGAAVLGAGIRSGWSTLGAELRLLPPKRRGDLEVQSASLVLLPCARLDALGFCGVVAGGVWSGGPAEQGRSRGVLGGGG
ncbi:MAG: hypothetical protein MUF64_06135, partial [Polyangiaceae bacterium]|nr:hypothetical protein [Polyangiaceae bacterium]